MTTTVGDNGSYNYQGVTGSARDFPNGEKIFVGWYNNSSGAITFTPKISFTDSDRPDSGWHSMSELTLEAGEAGISEFVFDASTAGSYSVVNVNVNEQGNRELICDKISIVPPGTQAVGPNAPTSLRVLGS
jgi:hypothetical protein